MNRRADTEDGCPDGWGRWEKADGLFLRGWDPNGRYDDKTREPGGDPQLDSLQEHVHGDPVTPSSHHIPDSGSGVNRPIVSKTETLGIDKEHHNARVSDETRPVNIAVVFCIKDED
jgi:hypothetical protein